jgi:hypothetical protein
MNGYVFAVVNTKHLPWMDQLFSRVYTDEQTARSACEDAYDQVLAVPVDPNDVTTRTGASLVLLPNDSEVGRGVSNLCEHTPVNRRVQVHAGNREMHRRGD